MHLLLREEVDKEETDGDGEIAKRFVDLEENRKKSVGVKKKKMMEIPEAFLRNPLHAVYQLVSLLAQLAGVLIDQWDLVEQFYDLEEYSEGVQALQQVKSFSITSSMNDKKEGSDDSNAHNVEGSVRSEREVSSLCDEISSCICLPALQRNKEVTEFVSNILKLAYGLRNKLKLNIVAAQTQHVINLKTYHRKRGDTNNESSTVNAVILCHSCLDNGPKKLHSERKRKIDAFDRPNKHVYNGYCPCCE